MRNGLRQARERRSADGAYVPLAHLAADRVARAPALGATTVEAVSIDLVGPVQT